jgi:hypothetical protein
MNCSMCELCHARARSHQASPARAAHPAAAPHEHPVLGLQRSAGNRAVSAMLQRDPVRRPSWWMPESPTVNIAAERMQQSFLTYVRPLTEREKGIARPVFQDSVDLERVRVGTTSVLAAPTTLANTIRVKDSMSDDTLIHELTHVWQYQTSGLRYVSCALAGQIEGAVGHGSRNWTYEFDPTRLGTRLGDYGPEQQAQIVQYAYLLGKLNDTSGFYGPLVAEVRRARPRPDNPGRDIDEAAGVGNRRINPLGPMGVTDHRSEEMGGFVPQLQWRIPGT